MGRVADGGHGLLLNDVQGGRVADARGAARDSRSEAGVRRRCRERRNGEEGLSQEGGDEHGRR